MNDLHRIFQFMVVKFSQALSEKVTTASGTGESSIHRVLPCFTGFWRWRGGIQKPVYWFSGYSSIWLGAARFRKSLAFIYWFSPDGWRRDRDYWAKRFRACLMPPCALIDLSSSKPETDEIGSGDLVWLDGHASSLPFACSNLGIKIWEEFEKRVKRHEPSNPPKTYFHKWLRNFF